MVRTPNMSRPGPVQETLPFQRPKLDLTPPPPTRTRHKKGRIRRGMKKAFLTGLVLGGVGFGLAWSQGWTDPWLEDTWAGTMALSVKAGFALEDIKTEGHTMTQNGAILEVMGLSAGDPMFGMDMEALESRIESLPWVRQAMVSRELPGTLKVMVMEREPFARWQIEGELVLVDESGAVIRGARTSDYADLPFVVGAGAPEAASGLFGLLATTPDLADRVVAAVRVGQRRWDLEFDTGMRLKLPEPSEAYGEAEAWDAFIRLNSEKNLMGMDVSEADFRLSDRVVMRLTPEGQEVFENMKNDQKT